MENVFDGYLLRGGVGGPSEGVEDQFIESRGMLFLGHHSALVKDFEPGPRIEVEELGCMLDRVGTVLLTPNQANRLGQLGKAIPGVRIEIAGKKRRDCMLRARLMARRIVSRYQSVGGAPAIVKEFAPGEFTYAPFACNYVVKRG